MLANYAMASFSLCINDYQESLIIQISEKNSIRHKNKCPPQGSEVINK